MKQKEAIPSKRTFPKEAWSENKESLQIDIEGNGIGIYVCQEREMLYLFPFILMENIAS